MSNKHRLACFFPALALLILASCQDHHFQSYDQVGALPLPEKLYVGDLVSGKVELGDSVKLRNYKDWYIFVIVRPKEGISMLAATREQVKGFPLSFTVTTKHLMVGKVKPGDKFIVEARLDKDGVLDTKEDEVVTGKYQEFELGHTGAEIKLNTEKGS